MDDIERKAIEEHIAECRKRIGTIEGFMKINPDCNKEECMWNIKRLEIAISSMQELQQYRKLREQGKLLELPCKVGDTLCWNDASGKYHEDIANCIYVERGLDGIKIETLCCQIDAKEIGKTVFLPKKLPEERKNNGRTQI